MSVLPTSPLNQDDLQSRLQAMAHNRLVARSDRALQGAKHYPRSAEC